MPNDDYSGILASIDLMSRCAHMLAVPVEEIIEVSKPVVRRKDTGSDNA